jgi:hypothetical protein
MTKKGMLEIEKLVYRQTAVESIKLQLIVAATIEQE